MLVVFALMLAGCQHKPLLIRGAMNVGGKMDMSMDGDMTTSMKTDNAASRLSKITVSGSSQACGRIAVVDVDGLLVDRNRSGFGSLGENPVALFREKLRAIADDASISAVVLRINSPGGGVTASDVMAHELIRLKQKRQLPIVACLMSVGAGGGYYLATHADAIVAHPTSVVGGIGVILNLYNMEDTMGQFNVLSMSIKSGEKIDTGSPEREMRADEKELLQQMADSFHQRFIDQVLRSRGNASLGDETFVDEIFDGRVLTGTRAAECALVDQIGYVDDAINTARAMAGLGDDASVVMLRRDNDRAYTVLDVSPNEPLQASLLPFKLPGLDRASLPTFMYLWQPEPSMATP